MPNVLLLVVGTAAFLTAAAMLTPRVEATISMATASMRATVGATGLVEQARMTCTHRRVCRPGQGCAWRKVCKRW